MLLTSEWPTKDHPERAPFIVQQVSSLQKAGICLTVFPFRGAKSLTNYWRAWLKVQSLLQQDSYDLIHAHFGQSGLLAIPHRLPLVVSFWGSDLHGIVGSGGRLALAGYLLQMVSQIVAWQANDIVVVSEHMRTLLWTRKPVQVIPGGIDLDLFRPIPAHLARHQLGLPADKYLVLFAADPARPVKRFELAKKVIEQLTKSIDVELVATHGVAHETMALYMNACDALLLTSQHEGSPTVVKEALACNLPVISVDVGDVRQRIEDISGCFLCPDDRVETIADGVAQVLAKRHRIDGRSAVADLDERLQAEKVISVYRQVLTDARV